MPSKACHRANFVLVDLDFISCDKAWTRLSIPGSVRQIAYEWLNSSPDGRMRSLPVQISTRHLENTTILDVIGDIDLANSPTVRKALLTELREKKIPRVIMNLQGVKYIDSSGIASLVEGLKASRDVQARFILFGLSKSAREVLQLSRLLKLFEIYENEEQALSGEGL